MSVLWFLENSCFPEGVFALFELGELQEYIKKKMSDTNKTKAPITM